MIDRATIQRIKDTANIVEVVSDYVHLTRRGANYTGLCPFHNERTPSFSVNTRRNFCYCFSCHKGGSPVNFIMEKEGVSYYDALKQLAKKYGIKIEERELTDEEKEARTERESLMVATEWAMHRMEQDLHDTEEGRDIGLSYFYQRGVTQEAIKAFHLGYALDKSDNLTKSMLGAGFELDVLRKLGLTGVSAQGHKYDKYRGRVIFPILNSAGKAVALGGRDLKGGAAKYINSPDSLLYNKSNELYGIFQAKGEMTRQNKCYLVEGYMDVISMWQAGVCNVVASSGTALTDGQISMIHRFTDTITLIYDGDAAGVKAALRGIDMLLDHRMKVKVLLLPDNHDPDSFARTRSAEELRRYITEHETDVVRFKIQAELRDSGDDPQRRAGAINNICRTLAHIQDDTERRVYIEECSRLMDIPQETVLAAVNRHRGVVKTEMIRSRERSKMENEQRHTDHQEISQIEYNTDKAATEAIRSSIAENSREVNPLLPLETSVIEKCVKFGFLPLRNKGDILVIEAVSYDMENDNISFSHKPYNRILDRLFEVADDYYDECEKFLAALDKSIDQQRREAIAEIASKGLSLAEIQREEKLLEKRLSERRENEYSDFCRDYPGIKLASDDDDEIRMIATELLADTHTLSTLFTKNDSEKIEEVIERDVAKAMTELKNEILELRVKDMMQQVSEAMQAGDVEKQRALQLEILKYLTIRNGASSAIGDRVISARMPISKIRKNNG